MSEDENGALNRSKRITHEERMVLLDRFERSGMTIADYAAQEGIKVCTFKWWIQVRKNADPNYTPQRSHRGPYSAAQRKKTVEAFLQSGMPQIDFAKTWGVGASTLNAWLKLYRELGPSGLDSYHYSKPVDKRKGPKLPQTVRDEIIDIKKKEPSFGFKKIKDWMFRFRGVKVSTGTIGKTVKAEGLPLAIKPKRRYRSSDKIRRFERATPMQLWQSDITQFTLARTSTRIYLTVFMDDHSRFIVGWRLQTRQTADLVIDAYKDGASRFGKPQEVLTDQGRQYFAWRGKSEFEKLLEKEGIKHVVSRSHHPQTLGKCERFWETVGNEFWTRARPQDLEEARTRFQYFVDHYNFQRPHQGLNGHCPADRFFGVTDEVRAAIEKTIASNALLIALGELPKPPAFLIGQIGEQRISFHGTSGEFVLTHENLKGAQNENGRTNIESNEFRRTEPTTENRSPSWTKEKTDGMDKQAETPISGDTSSRPVGPSVGRGSWTSTDVYGDHNGILDGTENSPGGRAGTGVETDSILATDTASSCRNVYGPSNSAENKQREHDGYRAGYQKADEED